jgi:inner membrane protein
MEPVTHILTGACLARTGLNRKAAYATLTMMIAAEFPDIDMVWSLRGPVESFQHHRGITHTFLGIPFEAAIIVAGIYGLHCWRVARSVRQQAAGQAPGKPLTVAPLRWGMLYALALVALLSHLFLDYTNNYGLRPFYPFNSHWYAASIVFIFDPVIFALLLGALVAPLLFGLIGSEVGARRDPFRGRGWAIAALLGVVSLWGFREFEHEHALQMQLAQNITAPVPAGTDPDAALPATYLQGQRVLASPDPLSPFRWSGVIDFGPFYQLNDLDTRTNTLIPADSFESKPMPTPAIRAAEASPLGRIYIDWSPMPFIHASRPDAAGLTTVTFTDPRFLGGWLADSGHAALAATVTVDVSGRVVEQVMDGREER